MRTRILLAGIVILCMAAGAGGQEPIRDAKYPAVSPDGKTICFTYLGDLWSVPVAGGRAMRLTVHPAYESYPRYSPDGKWIAFCSNREGNDDIYVMPAGGGTPERITYHTNGERVLDWTPDGNSVLFVTNRDTRHSNLYVIDIETQRAQRITDERMGIQDACYSPDGRWIAMGRGTGGWNRPKYKGATNTELYLLPLEGQAPRRLTENDINDMFPMWSADGETIYFTSCRKGSTPEGVANLWRISIDGGRAVQMTAFDDDSVYFPSISRNGEVIAFQQGFDLWTLSTRGGEPTKLTIYAPSDVIETDIMHMKYTGDVSEFDMSRDGKRVALAVHGEIFWMPSKRPKHGDKDATRVTDNPTRDYQIAMSPDGKRIAYISNESGVDNLYLADLDSGEIERVTYQDVEEHGPSWSPDGKWLVFTRGSFGKQIIRYDPETKEHRVLVEAPFVGDLSWSPDSRWLSYACETNNATDIWVVRADGSEAPHNITQYPRWNANPHWSADGKWIFFVSNRDSDEPQVYRLPLLAEYEDEEEKPEEELEPWEKKRQTISAAEEVQIDFDGIELRAVQLTGMPAGIWNFAITRDSKYILFATDSGDKTDIWRIDIKGEDGPSRLTHGGESPGGMFVPMEGESFYYLSGGAIKKMGTGGGGIESLEFVARMDISRNREMYEIFDEGWQALSQRFYDPEMHGVDWMGVRDKYRPMIEHCAVKEELYNLFARVLGELNASHLGMYGSTRENLPTAYLGTRYDESYAGPGVKVADVIPRSPADEEHSRIRPGEYILSVDGVDVSYNEMFYATLLDKVGKRVTLLVNDQPTKDGARTVELKTISGGESGQLLYEEWVNENEREVEDLSGGKVAYLHIQGMGQVPFRKFKRWLYGDKCKGKQALIMDVRYNGGGWLHDDLYAEFAKRPHAYERTRDLPRHTMPPQYWDKPVVVLQNEYCGSDAEIVPSGMRYLGYGTLLGRPTYGGVIGTYDTTLLDGITRCRVPCNGWWMMDGTNLENYGVPPDIDVENTFESVLEGRDVQLERAVEECLKQIGK